MVSIKITMLATTVLCCLLAVALAADSGNIRGAVETNGRALADEEAVRADEEAVRADEEEVQADEERLKADKELATADESRVEADSAGAVTGPVSAAAGPVGAAQISVHVTERGPGGAAPKDLVVPRQAGMTVRDVKRAVEDLDGIPVAKQKVVLCEGKQLRDDEVVTDTMGRLNVVVGCQGVKVTVLALPKDVSFCLTRTAWPSGPIVATTTVAALKKAVLDENYHSLVDREPEDQGHSVPDGVVPDIFKLHRQASNTMFQVEDEMTTELVVMEFNGELLEDEKPLSHYKIDPAHGFTDIRMRFKPAPLAVRVGEETLRMSVFPWTTVGDVKTFVMEHRPEWVQVNAPHGFGIGKQLSWIWTGQTTVDSNTLADEGLYRLDNGQGERCFVEPRK